MGNRTAMQHDGGLWDVYGYDAVDQLVSSKYSATTSAGASPASTTTYQYDPVGNRQQMQVIGANGPVVTNYATANPVNQYPGINGNPLTYDGNGNLTAMQNNATPSSPITACYDAQNRLLSATRGSGGSADTMEVVYDPLNRPIYRTVNGQKLFYVWDGWDLVAEQTEAQREVGEYQHVYVHGAEVDEILTTQQGYGGARRYHHHDALGSVIALTDDTGALLESYTYDVFGTPQVFDTAGQPLSATQHGNRFLYTGREWIAQLSLYDYRNRVYSAEIGRFMQTDPIGFAGGDVNMYRYVGNAPALYRDPTGKFAIALAIPPILVAAAAAALVAAIAWPFIAPHIPPINITPPYPGPAPYVQPYTPPSSPTSPAEPYTPPSPPTTPSNTNTPPIIADPSHPPTSIDARPGSTLPTRGPPGGSLSEDRGNGNGTIRDYGPDGRPRNDYDFGHDHGSGDPHAHDWCIGADGKPKRGPHRPLKKGE